MVKGGPAVLLCGYLEPSSPDFGALLEGREGKRLSLYLERKPEARHEFCMRVSIREFSLPQPAAQTVCAALFELGQGDAVRPVSSCAGPKSTRKRLRAFVINKSSYHLDEADPHTPAMAGNQLGSTSFGFRPGMWSLRAASVIDLGRRTENRARLTSLGLIGHPSENKTILVGQLSFRKGSARRKRDLVCAIACRRFGAHGIDGAGSD